MKPDDQIARAFAVNISNIGLIESHGTWLERATKQVLAAIQESKQQQETPGNYAHNPAHKCGTCASCGEEMVWNVPRLGPDGGFIHKGTGKFGCETPTATPKEKEQSQHVFDEDGDCEACGMNKNRCEPAQIRTVSGEPMRVNAQPQASGEKENPLILGSHGHTEKWTYRSVWANGKSPYEILQGDKVICDHVVYEQSAKMIIDAHNACLSTSDGKPGASVEKTESIVGETVEQQVTRVQEEIAHQFVLGVREQTDTERLMLAIEKAITNLQHSREHPELVNDAEFVLRAAIEQKPNA